MWSQGVRNQVVVAGSAKLNAAGGPSMSPKISFCNPRHNTSRPRERFCSWLQPSSVLCIVKTALQALLDDFTLLFCRLATVGLAERTAYAYPAYGSPPSTRFMLDALYSCGCFYRSSWTRPARLMPRNDNRRRCSSTCDQRICLTSD